MEIINFLKAFAEDNGATAVIVLVLTVILTNLIKIPIKKHAQKIAALAQKSGFKVTEKFVTSMVVYIPFGITLVLFCIADAISLTYGGTFDFVVIMAKTPVIAAASIGLYSVITNTIDKAAEKTEYKEYKKSLIVGEADAAQPPADPTASEKTAEVVTAENNNDNNNQKLEV